MIEVDGETYTAPHSFDWAPGTSHTIGTPAPQKIPGADYFRYLFAKWSDGGAQSHSVTASSETTVFIANFIGQERQSKGYSSYPPRAGTFRFDPPSAERVSHARFFCQSSSPNPPKVFRLKAG